MLKFFLTGWLGIWYKYNHKSLQIDSLLVGEIALISSSLKEGGGGAAEDEDIKMSG